MLAAVVALGLAILFGSSAVEAASVSPEHGEVLVNRGDGYELTTRPTEVGVGGQVMVRPDSRGRVAFADGCLVKVVPGIVFTITAKSPCQHVARHIETGNSLKDGPMPEQSPANDRRDAFPFLAVVGVAAGFVLLPTTDRAASP
jgi:hypothetical protein